jgi:HTH-type transcriptional regulator / antitoxin HigA
MAKNADGLLRSETDYDAALEDIERYFEKEPEPGTPEAGRFDFLASIIEDYECKHWAI